MKRLMLAALAVTLFAAGSAAARAEESAPEGAVHEAHEGHEGHMAEHMKKKLGLSDDQADKLEAAFKAQREAAKPLFDKLRVAQDRLQERVDESASDKELQASLDEVAAARKALQAQREKFEGSLAAILSPKQRAQMQLAMAKRMRARRMMGRRRGSWGERMKRRHDDDDEKQDD